MTPELHAVADAIERYVEPRFFDPQGILYAYVDAVTGEPFERDQITVEMVPRRAEFDPWAFWTYEDSIQSSGIYLDALVRKHEVTGDKAALEQAAHVWSSLRKAYHCSQVFGIGSFLRPYGGYEGMARFAEPLGTDQASPMFAGAYFYMKHVPPERLSPMTDLLLNTLVWYERQGFEYFYYKFMMHEWSTALQHAASFYVPAIAWAGKVTGDPRWQRYLNKYLGRLERGPVALVDSYHKYNLYRSFCWGSDLRVLRECLGPRFEDFVPPVAVEHAFALCLEELEKSYPEPGLVQRVCPQSAEPGFVPHMDAGYDRRAGMGFAYYGCVHQGMRRPRMEQHFLCALAELGHQAAFHKAVELMRHRLAVPTDFTEFLFEGHEQLPPQVRLYARSVGAILLEWYRDYWLLRGAEARRM